MLQRWPAAPRQYDSDFSLHSTLRLASSRLCKPQKVHRVIAFVLGFLLTCSSVTDIPTTNTSASTQIEMLKTSVETFAAYADSRKPPGNEFNATEPHTEAKFVR